MPDRKGDGMKLQDSVESLKGVGKKTSALLEKLDIRSIYDLLHYYPSRYEYYQEPTTIEQLSEGQVGVVVVKVVRYLESRQVKHLHITKCLVSDGRSELYVTFYNMPYCRQTFLVSKRYWLRGMITQVKNQYRMEQPVIYSQEQYDALQGTYQAIYPLTKGLTNTLMRKAVAQGLTLVQELPEGIPSSMSKKHHFPSYEKAISDIHIATKGEEIQQARATLIFHEFFQYFYYLLQQKEERNFVRNEFRLQPVPETKRILESLPYELTNAQKQVWEEIQQDMASESLMNRLIQGDVGSGKTILAYLALILCVGNHTQGALMVPTEVLAKQHFDGLVELFRELDIGITPILLTGSLTAREKRMAQEQIATGEAQIIIGTHALFQEKVSYHNLSLVITDEQHRFGVRQRESLSQKGKDPHVLVMSATPIPRTLALVLYADVSLSIIDELPNNRLAIKNCVIEERERRKAYSFLEKELVKGHQGYVICKMIEEGESEQTAENVISYTQMLQRELDPTIHIEYLHGKMKPNVKEDIMNRFSQGEIQILVSTTVIEVGINVPNATVILIEDAGSFGLAQLHQLRGRVGRGKAQSYCIFVNTSKKESTKERLDIVRDSNDGFYIAQKDMELRGSGDLGGVRQSGTMMFRLGNILEDADLLRLAHSCAESIVSQSPSLTKEETDKLQAYMKYHDKRFDFGAI